MKKSLLVLLLAIVSQFANAQCNTTNGTSCLCPTGIDTCDLYPDLRVTESLLYSAELNPEGLGELRISVSTPNIGFAYLQVLSSNYFVCGEDTLYSPGGMSGTCPDRNLSPSACQAKSLPKRRKRHNRLRKMGRVNDLSPNAWPHAR